MEVGQHSWRKIQEGRQPWLKARNSVRRVWVFGDSLMRDVDREIYSLSRGGYRILNRSRPGANIRIIRDIVRDHLHEMQPEDLRRREWAGRHRRKGDC